MATVKLKAGQGRRWTVVQGNLAARRRAHPEDDVVVGACWNLTREHTAGDAVGARRCSPLPG